MNKIDRLFIRACKAKNPRLRVESVYRRFYLKPMTSPNVYIVNILAKLCDEHAPISTLNLISELDSRNDFNFSNRESVTQNDRYIRVLINKIRFSDVSEFPGLTKPLRFRNQFKDNYIN